MIPFLFAISQVFYTLYLNQIIEIFCSFIDERTIFTAALALRSRGLVIGSREEKEEEQNLQIAVRCLKLWLGWS